MSEMKRSKSCSFVVAMTIATLASAPAAAAGPSTSFTLTGTISRPATYALADLQALPALTQTVNYTAAGVPQTRTYTGTSLWVLLDGAGIVVDPFVNNDVLNRYVLATGSDGYKAVFSLGELSPLFGNRPDLVAYAEVNAGVTTPPGADGFARITAPGDIRGGRYVSNVVNLEVRASSSTQSTTGGGPSTQFSVGGAVVNGRSFDLAALQALPVVTRTVGADVFTGVSFWNLLNATVGISLDPTVNNDVLGMYVVATGTDGYKAVFSLGELSSNFGNQPDLIAYAVNGTALTGNGFARLVVPNDDRRGRWVSNLASLEVFSASPVPEPASAALALLGLVVVGLTVKRQRR